MSDFDLVIRGTPVDAEQVAQDGWLAVRDGKVALRDTNTPPAARESIDERGPNGFCLAQLMGRFTP